MLNCARVSRAGPQSREPQHDRVSVHGRVDPAIPRMAGRRVVIFRGKLPSDDFAIVANHWFRDPRLTGKAKGYMGYIATHDQGYRLTIEQMIAEMKESGDADYAGLEELVSLNYLKRVQNNAQVSTKSGRKGFGEVDYHFAEAAYEQQYERNWGWDRDGKGSCKTTGQRASGKSASARSQQKGDVSAGQRASGKSGSAKSGSANPDTKKITLQEDQGLEDQEKNTPLPPAPPEPSAPPPSLPEPPVAGQPPGEPDVPAPKGGSISMRKPGRPSTTPSTRPPRCGRRRPAGRSTRFAGRSGTPSTAGTPSTRC